MPTAQGTSPSAMAVIGGPTGPRTGGQDEETRRDHRAAPGTGSSRPTVTAGMNTLLASRPRTSRARRPGRGQQVLKLTCSPIDNIIADEGRYVEQIDET